MRDVQDQLVDRLVAQVAALLRRPEVQAERHLVAEAHEDRERDEAPLADAEAGPRPHVREEVLDGGVQEDVTRNIRWREAHDLRELGHTPLALVVRHESLLAHRCDRP